MKPLTLIRECLSMFVMIPLLLTTASDVDAAVYLSNLGNRWVDPGNPDANSIGDGHSLFPGQYTFTASFTTGGGSVTLNSITLEFVSVYAPLPWNYVDVQLYQVFGNQRMLLGMLGQPTINPTPTQWPQASAGDNVYTTYIDFHPLLWQAALQPLSQYEVSVSDPTKSPSPVGLLFSVSSNYTSSAGWQMGPTTGNSWGVGELLKLAVDAVTPETQFTYTTNNGAIMGYTGSAGYIGIPSMVYGLSVTSIAQGAFSSYHNLISVAVPNGVTGIGKGAFSDCTNLTSVTIPNGVTSIDDATFSNCTSLTSITIPDSVTNIGASSFFDCTSLTNARIGSGVISIGSGAFADCTSLSSVTIPNHVTSIMDDTFSACTGLTSITADALNPSYSSVDGVLFDKSQTTLLAYPAGKTGRYTIPSSVTNIGAYAFSSCTSLTSLTIPATATSIGSFVFEYCTNLAQVYFVGNPPSIGTNAFFGDSLATVYHLPGTIGWGPTFGDRPTALWLSPVQTTDPYFGVRTNQFGFTINRTSNLVIVVDASANLANPVWSAISTNTFTGDSFYFRDPQWTNYPGRFFRIRSP